MNISQETTFSLDRHNLNKQLCFNSSNGYNLFLNWVSSEFDLFLQEESNGLQVYFPDGCLTIKSADKNNNLMANNDLQYKFLEKGQSLIHKIEALHSLLLNTTKTENR